MKMALFLVRNSATSLYFVNSTGPGTRVNGNKYSKCNEFRNKSKKYLGMRTGMRISLYEWDEMDDLVAFPVSYLPLTTTSAPSVLSCCSVC